VSRGFLWQDLEDEVAAEFESLGLIDVGELFDVGCTVGTETQRSYLRNEWLDEDKALPPELLGRLRARRWEVVVERRRETATGMTPAEKSRVQRARRAVEGKCTDCENRREPGISRCSTCAKRLSEYGKNKRAAARAERERGMKERVHTVERPTVEGVTHHFTITAKCDLHDADSPLRADCERCGGSGTYEVKGYIIANPYPDGRLGEIFISVGKTSSSEVWIDQWARAASFALQYGAPVDDFFRKFVAQSFEPSGPTKSKKIPRCSSVLDYVARYCLLTFGSAEARAWVASMVPASTEAVQP
jgi:Zn finger protein HypA/HybF involved in hydrogenase expression